MESPVFGRGMSVNVYGVVTAAVTDPDDKPDHDTEPMENLEASTSKSLKLIDIQF